MINRRVLLVSFAGILLLGLFFVLQLLYSADADVVETADRFFTDELAEEAITNPRVVLEGNVIFDKTLLGEIRQYGAKLIVIDTDSGTIFTNIYQYSLDFRNYNIMLVVEKIDSVGYVRDCLLLEKLSPETRLESGAVEVNGEYVDEDITVVVNHEWRARFTEDISQAFKVDLDTKKIVPVVYDTIRLYAED